MFVFLNQEVYDKYQKGEKTVEESVNQVLPLVFSGPHAGKEWIQNTIRDFLYGIKGEAMVRFTLTFAYPSDGGGSGIGYSLRQNMLPL